MILWILTEERPKANVIKQIILRTFVLKSLVGFVDKLRIIPILDNGKFAFKYEVLNVNCEAISKIYIKIVSGKSSFVDYLVYYQPNEPRPSETPILAIEETKTDDADSRNTGAYQRATKFVYIEYFYKDIPKIMLYNLQREQKETPTGSSIFGTRMLLTIGVEIMGKKLDDTVFKPFETITELIKFKDDMRKAPTGNVSVTIRLLNDTIFISGKLEKKGRLGNDPNIGMLSLISASLRKLGWRGDIVITDHSLLQAHTKGSNKFLKIASKLNIKLDGLSIPQKIVSGDYWHLETEGEKLGTIFIHVVIENMTTGYSIFENHAGCEKGFFIKSDGEAIELEKYTDREAYKGGDTDSIFHIPDLIIIDIERSIIINIEGKTYENRAAGISDLENYDAIEEHYIKKYYNDYKIVRTVVLYGSYNEKIIEVEIGFLLNKKGSMILGVKAPAIFKDAIDRLIDYWKKDV